MDWFYSGLLIALSAGITAFTGYLLVRLFRSDPVPAAPAGATGSSVPDGAPAPGTAGD